MSINAIIWGVLFLIHTSWSLQNSAKLLKCANKYASKLEEIIDPHKKFDGILYKLVKERLSIHSPLSQCNNPMVINASPGSSGTRSLFLAMLALNVTSTHYHRRSFNCTYGLTPLISHDKVVFWGDTPFAHLWWYFLQACPTSRYVLTIIDPAKWHSARSSHYNTSLNADIEWDYTLPIPFLPPVPYPFPPQISPPLPTELTSPPSDLSQSDLKYIAHALSLKNNAPDVAAQAYVAFVELAMCAIPAERLLLLNFNAQLTADHFWTSLVKHLDMSQDVSAEALANLIAAGLPYWGRKACRLGAVSGPNTKCPFQPLLHRKQHYSNSGWPGVCK